MFNQDDDDEQVSMFESQVKDEIYNVQFDDVRINLLKKSTLWVKERR